MIRMNRSDLVFLIACRAAIACSGSHAAPSAMKDPIVAGWIDSATAAATGLGADKFDRVMRWLDEQTSQGVSLASLATQTLQMESLVADDDELELHRQFHLATYLQGRNAIVDHPGNATPINPAIDAVANSAGLFNELPFTEAINALVDRLAIPKPIFLQWDARARSRAFTMARVGDSQVLKQIHDELGIAINNGETFADFKKRLADVKERHGWTGTNNTHYRLVYDQNAGMAYSAGRFEQGTESGLSVFRYLPSMSDVPRADHAIYYNKLFRAAPGKPLPPWDYNCSCGWEWVFPDELEDMNIDPSSLPIFDPPTPASGYVWSASDYVSHKALAAEAAENAEKNETHRGEKVMISPHSRQSPVKCMYVCSIDLDAKTVPTTICLAPWGEVKSKSGTFVIDDESAMLILNAFDLHEADIPIDYEHHSVGGQYASPDGLAKASGWIKQMHAVPGDGIYGVVEWTERATEMLLAKEYKYLSPVVLVTQETRQAFELHSVGLTNKPAIPGMTPLVNSAGADVPDNNTLNPKESSVDHKTTMAKLKEILELQDASDAEKLAKVGELVAQMASGELEPEETAQLVEALIDAGEAAATPEGEAVAASVRAKDYPAAGKKLVLMVNSLTTAVAKRVPVTDVDDVRRELNTLKAERQNEKCEALIQAHKEKLAPAQREWFRGMFKKDEAYATQWIEDAPEHIANKSVATSTATPTASREVVIAKATVEFNDAQASNIGIPCSCREFVNNELRGGHLAVLAADEAPHIK